MARITKRLVDEAKPENRDRFLRDDELRGFGLKVTPRGAKVYFLEWQLPGGRGSPKGRIAIGRHGSPWTPEGARRKAQALLEGVRDGVNPVHAKREGKRAATDLAFAAYAASFIEGHAKLKAGRSWNNHEAGLRLHVIPLWKSRPLPSITRNDVSTLLSRLAGKPALAVLVHAILRKLFNWAVGRGDLKTSPMTGMMPPTIVASRDRVLTDSELLTLWKATERVSFAAGGAAVRLLILTGQRRSEVLGMSFEELDMANAAWTIPKERSKNGKAHIVPLSPQAAAELTALGAGECRRGLVFTTTGNTPISGVSKLKAALDKAMVQELRKKDEGASLVPWRLHDIRRTVATGLQKLGARFEVIEAVLNHVSGAKSGIAGVYQRHDWAEEKRQALEKWGNQVKRLGERSMRANVVPLIRA